MAAFAIGDIHGCQRTLAALLARIAFNPTTDTLWLTGDLVNRGPDSLGVLRWAFAHRQCVNLVLGNHDLALLAAYLGVHPPAAGMQEILAAADADILCTWLRRQPLALTVGGYILLHAGRLAEWEQEQALDLAAEAETRIQKDDSFFHIMYGDLPSRWHPALSADDRCRLIINAFTRLRILDSAGGMVLNYTGEPAQRPLDTMPWFDFPYRRRWDAAVICGHWSTLGLLRRADLLALDTGCLWGGSLTAVRLEDGKIWQIPTCVGDGAPK